MNPHTHFLFCYFSYKQQRPTLTLKMEGVHLLENEYTWITGPLLPLQLQSWENQLKWAGFPSFKFKFSVEGLIAPLIFSHQFMSWVADPTVDFCPPWAHKSCLKQYSGLAGFTKGDYEHASNMKVSCTTLKTKLRILLTFKENFATLVPLHVHPAVPDATTGVSREHHPFKTSQTVAGCTSLQPQGVLQCFFCPQQIGYCISSLFPSQISKNSHWAYGFVNSSPKRMLPVAEAVGVQLMFSQPIPDPTCGQFAHLPMTCYDSLPDWIPWLWNHAQPHMARQATSTKEIMLVGLAPTNQRWKFVDKYSISSPHW